MPQTPERKLRYNRDRQRVKRRGRQALGEGPQGGGGPQGGEGPVSRPIDVVPYVLYKDVVPNMTCIKFPHVLYRGVVPNMTCIKSPSTTEIIPKPCWEETLDAALAEQAATRKWGSTRAAQALEYQAYLARRGYTVALLREGYEFIDLRTGEIGRPGSHLASES